MADRKARTLIPDRFSLAMLVPVVLSFFGAAFGIVGFVFWSAAEVDQRSLQRQTDIARHVIDLQLEALPRDQESVTIWDDALYRARSMFDRTWVHRNLGEWMHEYFGHDEAVVLNGKDTAFYAMNQGVEVPVADIVPKLSELTTRISILRRQIADGGITAFLEGRAEHPPRLTYIGLYGGMPSIISLVPLVSDTGMIWQEPGAEFIHIAISYLDSDYAARLGDQYQIPDADFTRTADGNGSGLLPLTDSAGRILTFFQWTPTAPGQELLVRTLPAISAALLIAGLLTLFLAHQLWRKSRDLAEGQADAEHRAAHDALTGLPNRVTFDAMLTRVLCQRPSRDRRASVMMLDLDRFKQVNDTLGHRAGDDLIRAVGQRLGQLLGPDDALARLGGDEFAIVHVHPPGLTGPLDLSRRIIDAVGKPFDIHGSEAFVGVSIGIATADGGDADAHELTRKADIALYEAKSTGRNRAVVFEEAMNEFLQNRKTIEAELREALRRSDQLSVAFQPLYDSASRVIGAEVLARWTHPRLGMISPAHFIPVAEASGLIGQVGQYALWAACTVGARYPGLTFAVNISPTQLRDPGFAASVFDLLAETGMRHEDLELEITESILLEETSVATETIRLFRSRGIKIALDDFGTGYSSLNYLKRYPVDRIKIDRSFVSQLAPGSVSVAIVQAMVSLAHALDIEVTAEGVETSDQKAVLDSLGCNVYQGFLLSPPVTLTLLESILAPPQARVA